MVNRSGDPSNRPLPTAEVGDSPDSTEEIDLDAAEIETVNDTVVTEKPPSAGLLGDRYELILRLGGGAMGDVWRARDRNTGDDVAVKIMREVGDREFQGRFHREARVLTRIRHPSILEVLDYGTEPKPYLVMELLVGEDLEALLRREERIPLDRTTKIFAQICEGLQNVHDAGIIHRDVKPANIYLMENGNIKLVDFGLAKKPHRFLTNTADLTDGTTIEAPLTKRGNVVGTIKYMSPEQLSRADIDFRSDLWSVAVVLFRMLTGNHAFPGMNDVDTMLNIMGNAAPVPSRDAKDLPPKLDNFFLRALQRNPAHRFGSASEMAIALAMITAEAIARPGPAPRNPGY
jgi:serine/threonine-protein kinase